MHRYFGIKKEKNTIFIDKDDIHHIKNVMRLKPGELLEVVYDNSLYICEINSGYDSGTIIEEKYSDVKDLNVILVVPILPEEKMSLILQKSTELGVKEIIPVNMERCKYKYKKDIETKKIARWKNILKAAAMQSKRLTIPTLNSIKELEYLNKVDINILCSTDKENVKCIKEVLKNCNNDDIIQIVFGPEGGLTSEEEEKLVSLGFTKTTFGSRILRTETVPLYILSIVNFLEGE